jgi:organic hydroperoxide reductase OsmC/OhrA
MRPMSTTRAKVFEYAVEVDRARRLSIPGGAQIDRTEGWTADHLLLAALVKCSIEAFTYHAHRAGHEVVAWGSGRGRVTRRESDGRYAFIDIHVEVDAQLAPRAEDPADLAAKAERDCFVGASLALEPEYTWRVS